MCRPRRRRDVSVASVRSACFLLTVATQTRRPALSSRAACASVPTVAPILLSLSPPSSTNRRQRRATGVGARAAPSASPSNQRPATAPLIFAAADDAVAAVALLCVYRFVTLRLPAAAIGSDQFFNLYRLQAKPSRYLWHLGSWCSDIEQMKVRNCV